MIKTGKLVINLDTRSVDVDGRRLHVTGKEYSILELLSLRKGTTLTKEMFLDHLYGGIDEPELKIIDVFICKLRKKIPCDRRRPLHRDRVGPRLRAQGSRGAARTRRPAAAGLAHERPAGGRRLSPGRLTLLDGTIPRPLERRASIRIGLTTAARAGWPCHPRDRSDPANDAPALDWGWRANVDFQHRRTSCPNSRIAPLPREMPAHRVAVSAIRTSIAM